MPEWEDDAAFARCMMEELDASLVAMGEHDAEVARRLAEEEALATGLVFEAGMTDVAATQDEAWNA